jgi:decaprenylphospho-beta-D-erythro-pentofuranosid-2-ulose 2-reductase
MTFIIIGASSGLGRELSYKFAKNKNDLVLISRDERDLTPLKSDLEEKYKISVKIFCIDFSEADQIIEKLIPEIKKLNNIKGILFPVGLMHEKDEVNLSKESVKDIFYANFLSITLTIIELRKIINEKDILIVGFGSVSGLLGRNLNSNYAASKRALESYFESLAFNKEEKNFKVHFYTLGYLDTNLAFGKKLVLPKGRTSTLANIVYKNKDKKIVKRYFPYFWGPIALIIKLIPLKILIKIKKILK